MPVPNVPLEDQFERVNVDVRKPLRLCVPVNENGEDPGAPGHPGVSVCYQVKPVAGSPRFEVVRPVFGNNEFGQQTFGVTKLSELCVPSSMETH